MFKTKNTETGKGIWGTRGMGETLMSSNIPRNVTNISGNALKHFGKYRQKFHTANIPGNIAKHSGECHQIFQANVLKQTLIHKFQHLIRGIYENRGVYFFFTKT